MSNDDDDDRPYYCIMVHYSFVVTGPLAHYFYKMLDKLVPPTAYGAALKRLLVDRFTFAPLVLLLSLYILSRLEVSDAFSFFRL